MKMPKKVYFCTVFYRGVAQLASVLAWGARGRKFESSHPDKIKSSFTVNYEHKQNFLF